uniref:Uncharacterized protein n=1 Tax=Steinernema glaseri TaxID=37863 RepID=A0A1I7Z0S1_9BILA
MSAWTVLSTPLRARPKVHTSSRFLRPPPGFFLIAGAAPSAPINSAPRDVLVFPAPSLSVCCTSPAPQSNRALIPSIPLRGALRLRLIIFAAGAWEKSRRRGICARERDIVFGAPPPPSSCRSSLRLRRRHRLKGLAAPRIDQARGGGALSEKISIKIIRRVVAGVVADDVVHNVFTSAAFRCRTGHLRTRFVVATKEKQDSVLETEEAMC